MNTFRDVCGAASVSLALCFIFPYLMSIRDGRTRPHQYSALVFTTMNGISVVSQFLAGGRISILLYMVFFTSNAITLAASFKYGMRDTSPMDRYLLTACLVTIVIWVATGSNATAVWLVLLISVLGEGILILKIRSNPHTEVLWLWGLSTIATTLNLMTIVGTPVSVLYVRPVYGMVSTVTFTLAILYYRRSSDTLRIRPTAPVGHNVSLGERRLVQRAAEPST
jgi:hypothetical protein